MACDRNLQTRIGTIADDLYAEPHYLDDLRIVYPRGGSAPPMLLLTIASVHAVNNDQAVLTQALDYQSGIDRFRSIFSHRTGRNNNQQDPYIESGPLAGDIVIAEPTEDAPFGFWITVNAPGRNGVYATMLRYRSATLYDDGNPLPVIDSEMPGIEQRLGAWRSSEPLRLPDTTCPAPHLIRMELWCTARAGPGRTMPARPVQTTPP